MECESAILIFNTDKGNSDVFLQHIPCPTVLADQSLLTQKGHWKETQIRQERPDLDNPLMEEPEYIVDKRYA